MNYLIAWFFYTISLVSHVFGSFLNSTFGLITGRNYNNPESVTCAIILLLIVIIIYFAIKKLFYMNYR